MFNSLHTDTSPYSPSLIGGGNHCYVCYLLSHYARVIFYNRLLSAGFWEVSAVPLLFRFPIFFCGTLPKNRPRLSFLFCFRENLNTRSVAPSKDLFICNALLGFLNVFLSIRIKNSVQRHTLVKDLYVTFLIMYVFITRFCLVA